MAKKSIIQISLLFAICYLIFAIFLLPSSHLSVKAFIGCNGVDNYYFCGYLPPPPPPTGPLPYPNPTSAPSGKQNCKCFNAQGVITDGNEKNHSGILSATLFGRRRLQTCKISQDLAGIYNPKPFSTTYERSTNLQRINKWARDSFTLLERKQF